MADKTSRSTWPGVKPVPMKLFATWEIEKTSPNCIPRMCSLTLTRLVVHRALENDLTSIIIAVKMQSSKRILRSNEIIVPPGGLLDTELDLSFSLQYPHFLKRDCNKLQVMLQRRKKYKNRTILGFKTLAIGQVNMSHVLQRSVDKELRMFSDLKERTNAVAHIMVLALSSQPVDHEENGHRKQTSSDVDRSPDVDNDSDEEDVHDFNDQDFSSNDEMSDCEPMMLEEDGRPRPRKTSRSKIRPVTSRQRNIKQRFIALLKKFKVSAEDVLDSEADHDLNDPDNTPGDIDDLLEQWDDMSDSGPEMDTMSVMSTPKPRLRPFFTGRGSTHESDVSAPKVQESFRLSDDNVTRRLDNDGNIPRKALLDQLSAVLGNGDDRLPESVFLINAAEWQGQLLVQKLQEKQWRLICTCSNADVKAAISFLVAKIQRFCNSNSKSPSPIKVGVAGGDAYINSVLRPYVEQLSSKSHDWQTYTKFLVIPFGSSLVGKFLASIDSTYAQLFVDSLWKDTFDKTDATKPTLDSQEIINRVSKYLSGSTNIHQMPIAEAMVMCKGKTSDEESSQKFVPFLSEVKIGTPEMFSMSVEIEEGATSPPSLSSSPPASAPIAIKATEGQTPPSSPNISTMSPSGSQNANISQLSSAEFMDLQVDYWTTSSKSDSKKESNKCSLKTAFRSLSVCRLPYQGEQTSSSFSMVVVTREKKQKIMRIGKKAKEIESKSQNIDSISRLICTSKSQNYTLKVLIDGVEWPGVKFFQLSSQWQTHIKNFPVAVFNSYDSVL
ncbi:phosphofurin acidic cluster sorting protein 2-like isoform X3 [Haliotis cracherodii]|uniref:phosphofurin acidic cluster sorting protein 2-like isoform X3 n=1 Tax=Haliotis cracherodii TaxID=6455 RepID=UPI0039E900E8